MYKISFSENGIGWNSECQSGATRRRADLGKLRIPADEREAADLDVSRRVALRFFTKQNKEEVRLRNLCGTES